MNETSMTARLSRFGQRHGVGGGRFEPGRVRALHGHDTRVPAQHIGELSAPHVESIDARRSAPQQDSR